MLRGRRGEADQKRYTSFFMKQQVHMIAPKNKTIMMHCSSCDGTGIDNYQLPCGDCDGSGDRAFNIALYEYVGLVEVSGTQVTREGKTYSVRFFDLPHVPEMARHEESRRYWRLIDEGMLPMAAARWATQVPENCLHTVSSVALDTAYEFNLDILQGFTNEQALLIMKLFDSADDLPTNSPAKESGSNHPLPRELVGEFPELSFDEYTKALSTPRLVTEADYRKRLANVKIEAVLT